MFLYCAKKLAFLIFFYFRASIEAVDAARTGRQAEKMFTFLMEEFSIVRHYNRKWQRCQIVQNITKTLYVVLIAPLMSLIPFGDQDVFALLKLNSFEFSNCTK